MDRGVENMRNVAHWHWPHRMCECASLHIIHTNMYSTTHIHWSNITRMCRCWCICVAMSMCTNGHTLEVTASPKWRKEEKKNYHADACIWTNLPLFPTPFVAAYIVLRSFILCRMNRMNCAWLWNCRLKLCLCSSLFYFCQQNTWGSRQNQ